jgi:hypothetical protein
VYKNGSPRGNRTEDLQTTIEIGPLPGLPMDVLLGLTQIQTQTQTQTHTQNQTCSGTDMGPESDFIQECTGIESESHEHVWRYKHLRCVLMKRQDFSDTFFRWLVVMERD